MQPYVGRFRGAPSSVREARQAIKNYARLCGFSSDAIDDVVLAAGEAIANAVEHGTKGLGSNTIRCEFDECGLTIEVRDEGQGFEHGHPKRRDPQSIRGFGISIMRSTMDDVRYLSHGTSFDCLSAFPSVWLIPMGAWSFARDGAIKAENARAMAAVPSCVRKSLPELWAQFYRGDSQPV